MFKSDQFIDIIFGNKYFKLRFQQNEFTNKKFISLRNLFNGNKQQTREHKKLI